VRRAAASAVGATVLLLSVLGSGACAAPRLDRAGARAFTEDALRASGLGAVRVVGTTSACSVEGAAGWRTIASTDVGEVSMCVSRDQGRVLSVRDPGMSDAQFARLERYRSRTAADRAMPLAVGSAVLLLVGTSLTLLLQLRPLRDRPS
jgi:hypothetical protein